MKNCAILSMDDLSGFECFDSLIIDPLLTLGWKVKEVSWRSREIDWNDFEAVIIRSPWDYQDDPIEFLSVLKEIEQSSALLANTLDVVNWNINKRYLAQLEKQGVTIVPTLWDNQFSQHLKEKAFAFFSTDNLILKPCISAGANDTFRLNKTLSINTTDLQERFTDRDFMIQPFMPSIISEGEYSLFYFDSVYSHAILKTPAQGDFRVQEEFGGQLLTIEPEEPLLLAAEIVLKALPFTTLYARLDFVRSDDKFALMEAELIEPSLYFNMDPLAAKRFADAFEHYYQANKT